MRLIFIDGGPASGKNTLGTLLEEKLKSNGEQAVLLDLDTYVEEINPSWVWDDKRQEQKDQLKARENFSKVIDNFLQKGNTIIVIGERFLKKSDVFVFLRRINTACPTFLIHLSTPLHIRTKRLEERGPHSLIDLEKDQRERDKIVAWPGYLYQNVNSPEEDADNLVKLLENSKGLIDIVELEK